MFSPAIRVFSQENAETVPKKPGATNIVTRKPFIDRAVNAASPDVRTLKSEPFKRTPLVKVQKQPELLLDSEDDDLFIYDSFSYVEFEDNYIDTQFFCGKKSLNIHRPIFSDRKTPPPKLELDVDIFIKMPESNFRFNSEDFDDQLLELSVEDVSLPQIDLN
ncbi:hypothetical protein Zmor_026010 [Zophobas morio]|uniref:Securin n=1 Tax=Zophobas morio TaxID=2755281 RepID=A0AA38HSR2_9CUCU|nr:hypothetical protein Zmor_026010 [Zophobas morio]